MRKNHWISLALSLVIVGLMVLAERRRDFYFGSTATQALSDKTKKSVDYSVASITQRIEWSFFDWRFKLLGPRPPHPDIVILAIDEHSLKELHQWPWPRGIHARLIEKLSKNPPKALAFDVLFLEPFSMDPAGDRALIQATRRFPWVVHSYFFETAGDEVQQVHLPFPALLNVVERAGFVNAFIDEDGVLRSARGQVAVQDQMISLLSVEAASLYLGGTPEEILKTVPRDGRGRMFLNFVGKDYSFPYIPYADVLSGKYPAEKLAGKIILVGSSATGTFDHYPTPTSSFMPGVEFHANIIDNILRSNALRQAGIRWTYIWILIFGLAGGLILARCSAGLGAAFVVAAAAAYFGAMEWVLLKKFMAFDVGGPLVTLALVYVVLVIYRFFTEEREKRLVKTFFSQQVSGELLDVLMDNPEILKNAGERREMTVFFSDVAGFTSISERLQPEELVDLLNRYLTSMTEVIFENGGYVDKYMGDGIMAFWNGLLKQTDHAERACRCALGSVKRLRDLNTDLKVRGLVPLSARIGINTGAMAAGYMGSVQKKQFTVMGDNVNLGSRLEGANKAYGSSVMISEFTYEIVQDKFEVRYLDKIRVPGKAKPVKVFELLAEKGGLTPEWQKALPVYHDAINLFVGREFSKAREKFLEVSALLGQDKASMAYVERAEAFVAHPPEKDWDGVYEVKSK
jgi:adenylate cyclase